MPTGGGACGIVLSSLPADPEASFMGSGVRKSRWGCAELKPLAERGPRAGGGCWGPGERGAASGTVRARPGSVLLSCWRRPASRIGPAPGLGAWDPGRSAALPRRPATPPVSDSWEERMCGLGDNNARQRLRDPQPGCLTLTWISRF